MQIKYSRREQCIAKFMIKALVALLIMSWCLIALSLVCRTMSRGDIGFEPTAILSVGSTLFCATTKQVMVYGAQHTACLADASK